MSKKPRTGRYGLALKGKIFGDPLPLAVEKAMLEESPEWDWWYSGEYVIVRLFDEGQETERIAAKVAALRRWGHDVA